MKQCQVCKRQSDDAVSTCPSCGEASWLSVRASGAASKATEPPCKQSREGAIPSDSTDGLTEAELEALTAPTTRAHRPDRKNRR